MWRKLIVVTLTAACSSGDDAAQLVVTPSGLAPLRAGMTIAEARAAIPSLNGNADSGCGYVMSKDLPDSVSVMIENGRVARVDVRGGPLKTAEGAGIGDSEKSVLEKYAGRVVVQPHKYTSGRYLVVRPANGDTTFLIVFETDGNVVTEYRAGLNGPAQYVERCG